MKYPKLTSNFSQGEASEAGFSARAGWIQKIKLAVKSTYRYLLLSTRIPLLSLVTIQRFKFFWSMLVGKKNIHVDASMSTGCSPKNCYYRTGDV